MKQEWNPFAFLCTTKIPYEIQSPMTDFMQKGDVILYRAEGNQILGGLESDITDSPYSHAELYTGKGWSIEAGNWGVSFSKAFHTYKGVDIFRWKGGLSADQQNQLAKTAYRELAAPYYYIDLFAFPYLSRKTAAKMAANGAFICSELVAWCYDQIGLNPVDNNLPVTIDAPADLGISDHFDWLGCYNNSVKIDGIERNVWNDALQGKPNWLAKLIVALLVTPFSNKQEYYDHLTEYRKTFGTNWKPRTKNLGKK
jgi:hypothetical protein